MSVNSFKNLRVAIVCDWLTVAGGAEKVILGLHKLFPLAPIYTSLYNPNKVKGFEKAKVITSYLQKIPKAERYYQFFLNQLPAVFESFDLSEFDLVISSSHSCSKGIIVKPHTLHVTYCHSPMRYAWENHQNYIKEYRVLGLIKKIVPFFIHKIRLWDRLSADRVDSFIANSNYIKKRIFKYYKRDSKVIHPFIEPKSFYSKTKSDYFFAFGRITSYKKFDLIVEAFNKNGLPIKIAGTGNALNSLKKAANHNIEFLGYITDEELREHLSRAKALIFPQCEDFGITPLEAMASGCPVIAFKKGGALETIIENKTGLFFQKQSVQSLNSCLEKFNKTTFISENIINHAKNFSQEKFNQKIISHLENAWREFNQSNNDF